MWASNLRAEQDHELSPCFYRVSNHRRFDPHFSWRTSSRRIRSDCSCGYLVYIGKKNLDGQFFRVKLIVKWASCKSCRCPSRVKQTNKYQRCLSRYTIKVIFTVTAIRGLQSLVLSETPFSSVKLNQMNVMLSGTSWSFSSKFAKRQIVTLKWKSEMDFSLRCCQQNT